MLKFAKYQGNDVIQQPSTVEEKDFPLAFTKAFTEKMRNKAIVHLFAPCNHLESGEMFYQVCLKCRFLTAICINRG